MVSKVNTPAAFKRLVQEIFSSHGLMSPHFEEYRSGVGGRSYKCVRVRLWRAADNLVCIDYRLGEVSVFSYLTSNRYGAREVGPNDLRRMATALTVAAEIVDAYYERLYGARLPSIEESDIVEGKNLVPTEISRADP